VFPIKAEGTFILLGSLFLAYTPLKTLLVLVGFDLTPDMSEVGAFQLIKQGNLRVEIHFAEALTTTINVIMYAEFDNVIGIDRNRQVLFDIPAHLCIR
jgi:hypothetical protein